MTSPTEKPKSAAHELQDHALGQNVTHAHQPGAEYDHDHDDFEALGPIEENPIWVQDHVELTTVGIDIGSSGTQIMFSHVRLRRPGEELSSRYYVVSREMLYMSPVTLTPYLDHQWIDQRALGMIIDEAYHHARLSPAQIDIGAVILTGEALRRENAQAIAGIVAERAGDFVCAAAGHHMEAMLAAYGSGAAQTSAERVIRILNVDIGGGTTKLALIESGRVTATAAFHVGGRLQVVDSDNRIVRLEPGGRRLAERAGFDWSLGDTIDLAELDPLAEFMAAAVVSALVEPGTAATEGLFLTEPLGPLGTIDGVIFSGGVAEYIYGREQRDFGDLGRRLGEALRRKLDDGALPWPCLPAKECIRATVMGASEYSVQLSGNTHYVSQHGALLPRRNLQVIKPHYDFPVDVEPEAVAAAIKRQLVLFDLDDAVQEFALAFQWRGDPSYERVLGFARGIALGLSCAIDAGRALYLILDGDLAQVLGGVLRDDLAIGTDLMVIDGIQLVDFDYVDLGKIRLPSRTVPVTVKSLLFQDSRQETRPPRLLTSHHHGPHSHSHTHGNTHHDSLKFKMPGSELQGTHIIWG